MTRFRLVLPAVMLAVWPIVSMIATASSASGEPPQAPGSDRGGPGLQRAQFALGPGWFGPGPIGPGEAGPAGAGEFGPGMGAGPGRPPGPFGGIGPGRMGPPPPRLACEERIHGEAALRADLRSRLDLDAGKRDAWSRMEALGEPFERRARDLCSTLPMQPAAPPAAPDRLAFVETLLAIQQERLRVLLGPFREFYETLTPGQRAVLDRLPLRL